MEIKLTKKDYWVFQVFHNGKWWYMTLTGQKTTDPRDAAMLTEDDLSSKQVFAQHIADAYDKYSLSYQDVRLVKLTLAVDTNDTLNLNQGEFLFERQKRALKKLTDADIEALGLKNVAAFIKLKSPDIEEDPEDIDIDEMEIPF